MRWLPALTLLLLAARAQQQEDDDDAAGTPEEPCDPEMVGFELITGYVYSAPGDLLDSLPGTLMLTDCLETCQANESCRSVNYETGLCVLFASDADIYPGALSRSQFPVFTIYAQKHCLTVKPCERAWCFDRVLRHRLSGHAKKQLAATSRQDCLELCLGEREFLCRSANYNNNTGECSLSDMDRATVAGSGSGGLQPSDDGDDYLENQCVEQPNKLCEYKKLSGRILKTVDSVYQDVGSADECRELCVNSPFRCRSYDFGDTGEMVCRLSHHSRATLADIQDPYLDVPEATTHELSSCYNVSIECGSTGMAARIKTTKLFDGKIYAKGSPNSCVEDVRGSLEFELRMPYNSVDCQVRQQGLGRYVNDIVIQNHDVIVTSSDLGLAVTCQYDLTNKSVASEVDLGVKGEARPALSEESVVESPNVAMRITDRRGADVSSATVGDPLALKFEVLDKGSPFEIFVRDLVALDGVDSHEIALVDSDGCPTNPDILGPVYQAEKGILLSHMDAFKFPSSDVVQFRALVTPCMHACEPVDCSLEDPAGELRSVASLGRRRRRRAAPEGSADMLLVQAIRITDKFGFDPQQQQRGGGGGGGWNTSSAAAGGSAVFEAAPAPASCFSAPAVAAAGAAFLAAELAVLLAWGLTWRRRRRELKCGGGGSLGAASMGAAALSSDSLSKLYDSGFARRF
ncbi:uncharacterized protein LOC134543273 [Bacillus rossius redtenbacheri]|uniref:uncharacterized protein LOC134543273 n=1 Tax=Bacillus rossius redtenbacheri TaxID=93214 RepID=UPI002FDD816C